MLPTQKYNIPVRSSHAIYYPEIDLNKRPDIFGLDAETFEEIDDHRSTTANAYSDTMSVFSDADDETVWSDADDEDLSITPAPTPTEECSSGCECSICYDAIANSSNCCVTECGHKFHTSCLLKSLTVSSNGCPLCRKELVEVPEDEEDDDEEYNSEEEEENDEDEENDDEETGVNPEQFSVSALQIANKISKLGYTMADLVAYITDMNMRDNATKDDKEKYDTDYLLKIDNALYDILEGEIAVDYTKPKVSFADALKTNLINNKKLLTPNEDILNTTGIIYTC